MAEPLNDQPGSTPLGDVPMAKVQVRRRPSIVWLIPLVAAFIGIWMAVRAYAETGPTITITFLSAEGLEAGQTRIRHKDVEIGKVTAISLSRDVSHVVVKAEMKREAAGLLSENSRFWVVRARFGTAGISGLGTLLSGAYIDMDPGAPGEATIFTRDYKGMETPSIDTSQRPGALFKLRAEKLGSLNIGSPVHFRQIRVGEVAGFDLEKQGTAVSIKVFINAPYSTLVRTDTRFWDSGGMDLTVDANGLRMRSDSLVDLLIGGIAFENPMSLEVSGAAPPGQVFPLYSSHEKIYEKVVINRHYYVVNFNESVRGLMRGAPVEYQGIQVGQVEDFKLEFHSGNLEGKIPVLIALEPERFSVVGPKGASTKTLVQALVKRGLRAQLKTASLLTGSLFVDLGFHPETPIRTMGLYGKYEEIPAIPSTMGAMTSMVANLTKFSERLQKLPLEEVVGELRASLPVLRETLKEAKGLMARLDQKTVPQAEATLAQGQATLATLEKTLRSDSPTQSDLRSALEEFNKAARALRDLVETLERHPESLIFGKGKPK
jgi:paraquat-inducible protein B